MQVEHSTGSTSSSTSVRVPEEILEEALAASKCLLPEKTTPRYKKEYQEFTSWRKIRKVEGVNEDILLAYLSELSNKFAPNSFWTKMSMLKTCLKLHEKVDVSRYGKIFTFLRRKSENYKPKKAAVLTEEQLTRFLLEASNINFLLEKIILLFGIFGACRREELVTLVLSNIKDKGDLIVVTLEDTKNKTSRKFVITEDDTPFKGCDLFRTYASLRPPNLQSQRFFVDYRNGQCTRQFVGIHRVRGVPRKIAEFLQLEHPEQYSGHSFRRSSATMLVENGGDLLTLKKFGGWKSSTVAEQYVEESVSKKIKISKQLFNSTSGSGLNVSEPLEQPISEVFRSQSKEIAKKENLQEKLVISGNSYCVFNFCDCFRRESDVLNK